MRETTPAAGPKRCGPSGILGQVTAQPAELSRRETEVLTLLGTRLSNAQIASRLHISVRTVESHVSSLLRKYGVADRSALASIAGPTQEAAPRPGRLPGLPQPRTTFIGRDLERDAILAELRDRRLLSLVGPGGVGKTRLATVIASTAAPAFPYGGAFVDLVPVAEGFVAQAVAATLGVVGSAQQPPLEVIVQQLGRGPSLLVLDNCEHLLEEAAEFVERVMGDCPELTVLATSRERLAVPGERVVSVAPLPLASDAETLFQERAHAVAPEFVAEPGIVSELCARLDGMPLAIELAAARAASLGADGLLAGLGDRLRLLSGGRGTHERHRSLRAMIGWSHDLLEPEERALLRCLAVFAGAFDLDAAVSVAPAGSPSTVVDLLGRLAQKSMLVLQRGPVSRWRLLETIRVFAVEQVRAHEEEADVRQRHLRWAATTATALEARLDRADPDRTDPDRADGDWRADFDIVVDDLRAALGSVPRGGPHEVAHGLARSLGHLTYARRFLVESADHYQRAAELAPTPAEAVRDWRGAAEAATVGSVAGTRAFESMLACAEQAGRAGDGDTRAIALARAVEIAARFHRDPADDIPRDRLQQLLEEARGCGDPGRPEVRAAIAVADAWTAGSHWLEPDPELAETAAALARRTGDPVVLSASLDAVSVAATRAGRLRQAHRVAGERLALTSGMSRTDPAVGVEVADALNMVAKYAIAAGDLPAAISAARLGHTDDLIGKHPYASLSPLVTALVLSGHFDEALDLAPGMWAGWERAGRPVAPALAPGVLAVALAHGLLGGDDHALWWKRAGEVLGYGDVDEDPGMAPFAVFVRARLAVHTGRFADAEGPVARAFAAYPLSRHETYARAVGAELAVVAGLPDAAERLVAAAPAAEQNDWAAACLARATGRLHGDMDALAASVAGWERIGARFELEQTRDLARVASRDEAQRSR